MSSVTLYCCTVADCGKFYRSKVSLKRHVETIHYQLRDFKCDTCGDTFVTKQNLEEHVYLHSGRKMFTCTLCGGAFKQKNQLALHLRKHRRANLVVSRPKPLSKAQVRELEIRELFTSLAGEITPSDEEEQNSVSN